jgi:hypothetical protein
LDRVAEIREVDSRKIECKNDEAVWCEHPVELGERMKDVLSSKRQERSDASEHCEFVEAVLQMFED